jgi:Fe-S cluster biosynthesis and repair protein YggX
MGHPDIQTGLKESIGKHIYHRISRRAWAVVGKIIGRKGT